MRNSGGQDHGQAGAKATGLLAGLVGGLLGAALVVVGQQYLRPPAPALAAADRPVEQAAELAVQVANLQLALARLQGEVEQLRPSGGATVAAAALDTSDVPARGAQRTASAARPIAAIVATTQTLIAAGIERDEADAMVARLDELALARLQADYRVRTAAGDDANRARQDRRAIPQDSAVIRQDFGEQAYDQYLYALQQPNRVTVASVLRESSAQQVGVQPGDFLRSLDGEPLYSVRDLTQRIREGSPEQTYSLVVERNGERIETWVPGGPLGVRVSGSVVEPNS